MRRLSPSTTGQSRGPDLAERLQVRHHSAVGLVRREPSSRDRRRVHVKLTARGRATHEVAGLAVPFLGRAALVRNKRATGHAKDLADLEALGEEV